MNTRISKSASLALYSDLFPSKRRVHLGRSGHDIKGSVYTAFDGDHFYLTDLFSRHAFGRGWIPVNPEACLGYKQAVDALHTKRRVLAADVALLRTVDHLWVYTSQDHTIPAWRDLAEGVLVELLYWLSLGDPSSSERRRVFFVDLAALASGGSPEPREVYTSAAGLTEILQSSHPEVVELVEQLSMPNAVPPVVAAAYHIADSKNAHWLREWMLAQGWAPIIPTLAFSSSVTRGLGDLAASWLLSVQVADMVLWLDPLDGEQRSSAFLPALRTAASSEHNLRGDWSAVGAPKAVKGSAWPITRVERDELSENRYHVPPEGYSA